MNKHQFLSIIFLAIFSTGVLFYHFRQSQPDDINMEKTALKNIFIEAEKIPPKTGSPRAMTFIKPILITLKF